jgi:hypothetical protein
MYSAKGILPRVIARVRCIIRGKDDDWWRRTYSDAAGAEKAATAIAPNSGRRVSAYEVDGLRAGAIQYPHIIRVNVVAPGLIETDLNRKDLADLKNAERREFL